MVRHDCSDTRVEMWMEPEEFEEIYDRHPPNADAHYSPHKRWVLVVMVWVPVIALCFWYFGS